MAKAKDVVSPDLPPAIPAPWATPAAATTPVEQPSDPVPTPAVEPIIEPAVIESAPVAMEVIEGESIAPVVEEGAQKILPAANTVTVTVPKAYKLRVDDHTEILVKAGVQEMPLAHAEHWYSVANGVTVYQKG